MRSFSNVMSETAEGDSPCLGATGNSMPCKVGKRTQTTYTDLYTETYTDPLHYQA
jgi:hypothetical protein